LRVDTVKNKVALCARKWDAIKYHLTRGV